MKTLTVTDAKKNLTRWLQAAARGEEIGIVSGADVIALRKVEIEAADYALREYGVTPAEVERSYQKTLREIETERKAGKLKPWKR